MSEQETETPRPRHLQVAFINGLTMPMIQITEGEVEWWWEDENRLFHIGPNRDYEDADLVCDVWIPREQIAFVQESVCTCDHDGTEELDRWLSEVLGGGNPGGGADD